MNKQTIFQSMEYVYTVYKEQSFSKAAKKLHVTQPSLSNTIKRIEKNIGSLIFDRSTSPISLTELGKEYINSVEIIMDVQNNFEDYCNQVNNLQTGNIRLGGTTFYISNLIPEIIKDFNEKYPLINFELIESSTPRLIDLLNNNEVDLIVENYALNEDIFERKPYTTECMILGIPKDYKINEKLKDISFSVEDIKNNLHLDKNCASIDLKEVKDEPFLLLPIGNDARNRADLILEKAKVNPKIKLEPVQQITAYNLACNGMGIVFVGDSLVKHLINDDRLVYYKLDNKLATRKIDFYYKKNKYRSKAVEEFLKSI